ncbi:MAG: carboxymuconolactone decarboxylase family protein [Xanthomonadaceae bacterium]|nr:carboxymuconolactone decarboxylase family protein [Xanthomonadaceae bacterium]MDE2256896.1 carboxymuconolactone decarboxylase family protein [Xanthomonadaceae bacterium]
MNANELKSRIPDYARDLRLNLESVLDETGAPGLSQKQIGLVALASAIASRHEPVVTAIGAEAARHANAQELDGARIAASIMAMNNIYYRFTHLVSEPEYRTLRASLRMNAMANPGCDKMDFELCSIAVSAINGCGACMDAHEKTLKKHGVSAQAIQSAVRIAAVVHAVAVTLEHASATGVDLAAAA